MILNPNSLNSFQSIICQSKFLKAGSLIGVVKNLHCEEAEEICFP
jgi:hypothetical protein